MAYFFGGDTGLSPEDIRRQRAVADALLRQATSGASSIGEGLSDLGAAFGSQIARRRADAMEAQGMASADADFSGIISALSGGAPVGEGAPTGDPSYRDAIASIESAGSGDYAAVGPTHPKLGRALGRYQVMEANIGPWSQKHLGREVTPDEFMASPEIQDAIFDGEFGTYVDQYGPEGAAQAWFGGPGGVGKTDRTDVLGTSVGGYGNKFMSALERGGGGESMLNARPAVYDPNRDTSGMMNASPAAYDPNASTDGLMAPMGYAPQEAPVAPQAAMEAAIPTGAMQPAPEAVNSVTQALTLQPGYAPKGQTTASAQMSAPNPLNPGAFNAPEHAGIVQALTGGQGMTAQPQMPQTAQSTTQAQGGITPDILRMAGNKFLTPLQQRIIMQKIEQGQPLSEKEQLGLEKTRLEIEKLRNPEPNLSTDAKNFQFAKENPGFKRFLRKNKKAGSDSVNVNVKGEEEQSKKVLGGLGEDFRTMQQDARSARSALNSLDVMEKALGSEGFYSGAGGETVLQLKRWSRALGFDPEGVDSIEAFNAQAKQAALDNMGGSLGTGFSNADRDFVTDQVPGLQNTPEGNRLLVRITRKINERKLELAKIAREHYRNNGNKVTMDLYDELEAYAAEQPLFGEDFKLDVSKSTAKGRLGEQLSAPDETPAPEGVDKGLWKYMTPEQRALWN